LIAFATAITDEKLYERYAARGFRLAAEPDTRILPYAAAGSIFRSYNMLLEIAAEIEDLETVVLIHQDAEITDPDFIPKVRQALREPDVAIVGCAGAVDVRSIAWWEGSVRWASYTHRFEEFGGGEIPAMSWIPGHIPPFAELGPVDTVDGFVMAFSPWAIQNLRFDESLPGRLHGYDFDICMQARSQGKKVMVADLKVIHHHSLQTINDESGWIQAHMTLTEKWADDLPVPDPDWRARARRAEAELSVATAARYMAGLTRDLFVKDLEHEIDGYRDSLSWRLTRPLRWLGKLFGRGAADEPNTRT
jgi:hypothetical protein